MPKRQIAQPFGTLIKKINMRITKIEKSIDGDNRIYLVTLSPYWLERIFKVKEEVRQYRDTWDKFILGRGSVYIDKDDKRLKRTSRIGRAIDRWRIDL